MTGPRRAVRGPAAAGLCRSAERESLVRVVFSLRISSCHALHRIRTYMDDEPALLASLRQAVEAMPDDVPLRVHLATLLLQAGDRDEAVRQLGTVLQRDPANAAALRLLQQAAPAGPPAPARQ